MEEKGERGRKEEIGEMVKGEMEEEGTQGQDPQCSTRVARK